MGDSYKLIKDIPDKSVDLVIIDPPYLIETDGAGMFGNKSNVYKNGKPTYLAGERYVMKNIDFMKNGIDETILDELTRIMKKINIYLWCSQKQLMQLINYFANKKGCNWNLICWHKTDPVPACR